jgi:2'-5' RNA ligase
MHRLFVAIRPPRAMREALLAMMGGIPNARWQSDEQLHLTLRFIGEVDRHAAEDIAAALGTIHHPRFAIAIDGVGSFDREGRAGALWAGIGPMAALKALHEKIDQALRNGAGLPPEGRAYLPHVTLARLGRDAGPIDGALARGAGVRSAPVEIAEFCLYESTLGREGSIYEIVGRYRLD